VSKLLIGNLRSFGSGVNGAQGQKNRDPEPNRAEQANPESSGCPQGPRFSGPRCLPLGAQIGLVLPLWALAWLAVFNGLGLIGKRRRSIPYIAGGVAIGLIPLFCGIV
jgi:hypothetical protein